MVSAEFSFSFDSFQAACGIERKPKEVIVDIDSADTENDLAAVEYVEDIYKFYKSVEVSISILMNFSLQYCVMKLV